MTTTIESNERPRDDISTENLSEDHGINSGSSSTTLTGVFKLVVTDDVETTAASDHVETTAVTDDLETTAVTDLTTDDVVETTTVIDNVVEMIPETVKKNSSEHEASNNDPIQRKKEIPLQSNEKDGKKKCCAVECLYDKLHSGLIDGIHYLLL